MGWLERFTLDGRLELDFQNRGPEAIGELWFHAYLNAYSNDRSTHLITADGLLRGVRMRDGWGYLDVSAVRVLGEGAAVDVTESLSYEQPTFDNPDDRTVFRVDLPEPLGPGDAVTVEIEWDSLLPRVRRRTGTKGNFMLLSHWFPKLGVYETGRGWNAHPFHAFTEFYSDFGTYDVTLDMPAEYADSVFATGRRVNEVVVGDRVEVRFEAPSAGDRVREDVSGRDPLLHDFALTADPDYVAETFTFHYADWAARFPEEVDRAAQIFGEDVQLELPDVTVEVLVQPEHEVQAERHYEAAAAALFFYGLWYGPYPFERLTVVDPAWGASAAGGMEYPTLFTSGTRMFTKDWMHRPEGVTIHEAGHQWFQGIVANNEFETAWMDEGLNSFTDSEVLHRWLGPSWTAEWYSGLPIRGRRLAGFGSGVSGRLFTAQELRLPRLDWMGIDTRPSLRPVRSSGFLDWWREQPLLSLAPERTDPRWGDRRNYLGSPDRDHIDCWAVHALNRSSHYTNTYARTATVLRSLPAVISASVPGADGEAAVRRGMREYATEWRFQHPYPQDFFDTFSRGAGLGPEFEWFFEDLFRGTGTIDWAVSVQQNQLSKERGLFPDASGGFELRTGKREESQAAEPEMVAAEGADGVGGESPAEPPTGLPAEPLDEELAELPSLAPEASPEPKYDIEISVRRAGSLALPVPIRLEFEDGSIQEYVWSRADQLERRWWRLSFKSVEPLRSVQVDPDAGYFLETDRSNNGWFSDSDGVAPLRWAERVFTQVSHRLHWQKGLGG